MLTQLAQVDLDGERLSDDELAMFLVQLLVAGNETTRDLISSGLLAFADHPGQWARVRADRALVPGAVEEMLRWSSPVVSFMRTATRDTEVRGRGHRRGRAAAHAVRLGEPGRGRLRAERRRPSTWAATPTPISPSARATISAWAPPWPGSKAGSSSTSSWTGSRTCDGPGEVERSPSSVVTGVRRADLRFVA